MTLFRLIFLLFILANPFGSIAQKKYTLAVDGIGFQQIVKHTKTEFKDSLGLLAYLKDYRLLAIKKGFLLFSIDEIQWKGKTAVAKLHVGQKFGFVSLVLPEGEQLFIKKHSRLKDSHLTGFRLTPAELSTMLRDIEQTYLDNGFPFVRIRLVELSFDELNLNASLHIEPGNHYQWKAIHIKGDSAISKNLVAGLIGIKKGDFYEEDVLGKISSRVKQNPYLEEIKPYELLFTEDAAELYLYLKRIPNSSVNGIIGFQPDSKGEDLTFTGDINLKLQNTLNRGELVQLRWQSIREQTQSLKSKLQYPYLFKSPFGIEGSFNLYKRDTTYLELIGSVGILYQLNAGTYLKGFYERFSSNLLSGSGNNTSYSNLGNTKNNLYGIGLSINRLDYQPNPNSGILVYLEGSVGQRKSTLNDSSAVEESLTYKGRIEVNYFIPLYKKRHVLRMASQTYFYGAEQVFENELFRYGGLLNQRGFNEDALLASTFSLFTVEYRFLLDRNSYVFAFYDQSWYENNSAGYQSDTPLGFGAGFSFNSKIGMFSISYALGKQMGNPILLGDGKIHFGYVAIF